MQYVHIIAKLKLFVRLFLYCNKMVNIWNLHWKLHLAPVQKIKNLNLLYKLTKVKLVRYVSLLNAFKTSKIKCKMSAMLTSTKTYFYQNKKINKS